MGCYDSFDPALQGDNCDAISLASSSISQLHTLYEKGMREVTSELRVEGVVTANDEYENFYKSFIIEHEGYALEVLDGLYNSYVSYPLGSRIEVHLTGLGLDRYMGVLRTGIMAPATSIFPLDYMNSKAIVDNYVSLIGFTDKVTPRLVAIEALQESQAGELITIDALTLSTEDGVERQWGGYAKFVDASQNYIWCYTSPYASFASEKIPQGEVQLSGILEFGNTDSQSNQLILKLRGLQDCIY